MAITNKQLKNLSGGVSQQADSLRHDTQCTTQNNFLSDPVQGLVKRPGTTLVAPIPTTATGPFEEGGAEVFTHTVVRSGDTKLILAVANGKVSLSDAETGTRLVIQNAAGTPFDSDTAQTYLQYSGTYDTHPYAAVSIADHTFIVNKETVPAMTSSTSHGTGVYAKSLSRYGTLFIKEGAYNAEYSIEATDSDGVTRSIRIKTSDGLGAGNVVDSKTDNITAAVHAALKDTAASRTNYDFDTTNYPSYADEDTGITITYTDDGANPPTFNQSTTGPAMTFHRIGSVITWYSPYTVQSEWDDATNKIDISDSYGNTMTSGYTDVADNFEGLPLEGANNYILKIQGNPESKIDDYYVQFQLFDDAATANQRGAGRWVETLAKDDNYDIDGTTMPHILVKVNATTYQFKTAPWDDKVVGDEVTDPDPSFIGTPINDLFFFKSRLGLLCGESVVMSELDDPYNFWRTTVTQVLASDRIDISSSVNQETQLNFAVPFTNQMVIFSDRTQFIINYGNQGLTPQTASLAQIASYEASTSVRPVAIDANIIFAQERAGSTAIFEMFPTGTTELSFEAQDITEQVPSYIDGKAIRMAASSLAGSLLIQTDSSVNSIYCYKFFNRGRERILSSWFQYTFPADDIMGFHFISDLCYIITKHEDIVAAADDMYLINTFKMDNTETITFSVDQLFPDTTIPTPTYDSETDETEFVVQFSLGDFTADWGDYFTYDDIIIFDTDGVVATKRASHAAGGSLYVDGDWSTKNFYIGVKFDAEYEFSTQYLKGADAFGKEKAVVDGRTTVKWVEVYLTNSQYMTLEVSYPDVNRDTTTKTFSGNVVGSVVLGDQASETGTLRSIVAARNDVSVIKLKSSTHQTATINGASFELQYTSRLRQRN